MWQPTGWLFFMYVYLLWMCVCAAFMCAIFLNALFFAFRFVFGSSSSSSFSSSYANKQVWAITFLFWSLCFSCAFLFFRCVLSRRVLRFYFALSVMFLQSNLRCEWIRYCFFVPVQLIRSPLLCSPFASAVVCVYLSLFLALSHCVCVHHFEWSQKVLANFSLQYFCIRARDVFILLHAVLILCWFFFLLAVQLYLYHPPSLYLTALGCAISFYPLVCNFTFLIFCGSVLKVSPRFRF